jgi:hypothetical protein
MRGALWQTVESSNSRMGERLTGAQGALRGGCTFGANEVRALRVVLAEMAPVIAQLEELRRTQPEMVEALNLYRSQLVNLQRTVERLRIALLVHRSTLEDHRTHLSAASLWCMAFQRTRLARWA